MLDSVIDPFSTPKGYHRLASANDNDHTAYIVIVTTLGLLYGLLFGAFRWFVRSTICPGIGIDDYLTGIATVLQVIQACVVLGACATGLGRSPSTISTDDLVKSSKSYYTSTLFFLVAIGLTKMSNVYFLRRLAKRSVYSHIFTASTAIMGLWTIGAFFAEALQCDLSHPWLIYGEQCTNSFARWLGISIVDIITELLLVCLSVYLIWPLQARWLVKANVIATFAFRLIIIIPIAFRLTSFPANRTTTFPLSDSRYILWTQTQLCYAIISATIPTLRPFANSMNTQFGGFGQEEGTYGYGHSKSSKSDTRNQESIALKSMDSAKNTGRNPARSSVTTCVTAGPFDTDGSKRKAGSFDSKESQQMIIRKDTTFYVEHESEEAIQRV